MKTVISPHPRGTISCYPEALISSLLTSFSGIDLYITKYRAYIATSWFFCFNIIYWPLAMEGENQAHFHREGQPFPHAHSTLNILCLRIILCAMKLGCLDKVHYKNINPTNSWDIIRNSYTTKFKTALIIGYNTVACTTKKEKKKKKQCQLNYDAMLSSHLDPLLFGHCTFWIFQQMFYPFLS